MNCKKYIDVFASLNAVRFAAWGEYSHSFAAFLNQEECYRLILAKGANHDLQDSNGNTVTHIMVVYNNMRMFDLAVECGASINILNRYLQRAGRQRRPLLNLLSLTVSWYLCATCFIKMSLLFFKGSN